MNENTTNNKINRKKHAKKKEKKCKFNEKWSDFMHVIYNNNKRMFIKWIYTQSVWCDYLYTDYTQA